MLEKWVETRQTISKTRADWQSDKEMIEQSIEMFEREIKSVEAQLAKISTNNVQAERERVEAEAQKKVAEEVLGRTRDFSAALEPRVLRLVPKLPLPLQETLKPLVNRIPVDSATKLPAGERLQTLVGVLNELDKFNGSISVASEKRRNAAGEEIAVETIYIGLGGAYFVNAADDFAGTGTTGPNGWEWTVKPELASAVREALRIYRNERPARFIPLPAVVR